MRELVFTPEAAADYRTAYRWYESRRAGVGQAFRQAVDEATDRLRRSPQASRPLGDGFRQTVIRRFPYDLVFEFNDHRVVVMALFNTRQDPQLLSARLRRP